LCVAATDGQKVQQLPQKKAIWITPKMKKQFLTEEVNHLAKSGMTTGIFGLVTAFIPCGFILAPPICIAALLLSGIAYANALKISCSDTTQQKIGLATGGSGLLFAMLFFWGGTLVSPFSLFNDPTEFAQVSKSSNISWQEIDAIYNLHSPKTDIQKEEAWKKFKGKRVSWSGEVSDISENWINGLTLCVKMNPDTLSYDLMIQLKPSEKKKTGQLSKGDRVAFSGTLDNWASILPITLKDGEVLQE
jgi:hypothetical protein